MENNPKYPSTFVNGKVVDWLLVEFLLEIYDDLVRLEPTIKLDQIKSQKLKKLKKRPKVKLLEKIK